MDRKGIADKYIQYLVSIKEDKGAMAEFKRGSMFPPGTHPPIFKYVIPWIPENGAEVPYFLTASLFGMHQENTDKGDLGLSFKQLDQNDSRDGRFKAFIRCREEELYIHLRNIISQLGSKQIPVNYSQLFYDISFWEHPDKFIQKRLARSFWANTNKNENLTLTNGELK